MNSSTANMTPLKAIRRHCLYCMGGSYQLVRECPAVNCPLYPLRSGRGVKGVRSLKQIRRMCLDCVAGSPSEVKACKGAFLDGEVCPLHPYRLGRNPNRAGIGGSFQKNHAAEKRVSNQS